MSKILLLTARIENSDLGVLDSLLPLLDQAQYLFFLFRTNNATWIRLGKFSGTLYAALIQLHTQMTESQSIRNSVMHGFGTPSTTICEEMFVRANEDDEPTTPGCTIQVGAAPGAPVQTVQVAGLKQEPVSPLAPARLFRDDV